MPRTLFKTNPPPPISKNQELCPKSYRRSSAIFCAMGNTLSLQRNKKFLLTFKRYIRERRVQHTLQPSPIEKKSYYGAFLLQVPLSCDGFRAGSSPSFLGHVVGKRPRNDPRNETKRLVGYELSRVALGTRMGEEGEVRRLGEATYLFPVCEPCGAVFLSKMAGAHQDARETLRECTQSILNCISVMENGRKNVSLTSSNGGFCFETIFENVSEEKSSR